MYLLIYLYITYRGKYSPGENIHREKIFAGRKYSPGENIGRGKLFAVGNYSPWEIIRRGKLFATKPEFLHEIELKDS